MERVLIAIDRLLDLAPDTETEGLIRDALCTLADDMNASLDYDVELTHIDTADYLSFSVGAVDPEPFREDLDMQGEA